MGTPLCMDNFGWTEQDTVLYFGIIMACNGVVTLLLSWSIGPISKRFDERKLVIFVGILGFTLGRFLILPIPGFPLPPLKQNNAGMVGKSSPMTHYASHNFHPDSQLTVTHFNSPTTSLGIHNVPCQDVTGEPGCDLEWCKSIPAVTVWQFVLSWFFSNFGVPYGYVLSAGLFSKIIGPRPQVCSHIITRNIITQFYWF